MKMKHLLVLIDKNEVVKKEFSKIHKQMIEEGYTVSLNMGFYVHVL